MNMANTISNPNPERNAERSNVLPEGLNPEEWILADGIEYNHGGTVPSLEERIAKGELGPEEAAAWSGLYDQNGGLICFCSKEPGSPGRMYVGPATSEVKQVLQKAGYRPASSKQTALYVPFSINNTRNQPTDEAVAAQLAHIREIEQDAWLNEQQEALRQCMMRNVTKEEEQ